MTTYIILNGPSGCGKTAIARELSTILDKHGRTVMDSFASPIRHFLAAALSDPYSAMDKERSRPELNGESVNQFLLKLTDDYLRLSYGADILGRWLVHRSLKNPQKKPRYVIIDDGNSHADIDAVPNKFVVRVYRIGRGFKLPMQDFYPEPHYVFRNSESLASMWTEAVRLNEAIRQRT